MSRTIGGIGSVMLHEFVTVNREEIIRRCRAKVAARPDPPSTAAEIDHGVPLFLEQLVDALRGRLSSTPEITTSAVLRGDDMFRQGFTVSQVVHDYGDVCQSITELAMATSAPISADDFRILNGCLDHAIAGAVTEYGRQTDPSVTEEESADRNRQPGAYVCQLRDLIQTATLALEVIRSGSVGVGGSTGAILHRSLQEAHELITQSVAIRRPQESETPMPGAPR
jgi:hypothetical protein